MSVAIDYTVR